MILETLTGERAVVSFEPNGTTGLLGLVPDHHKGVRPFRQWILCVEVRGFPVVRLHSCPSGVTPVYEHDGVGRLRELFGDEQAEAWLAALRAVVA